MKKIFCDRCGKEITVGVFVTEGPVERLEIKRRQLIRFTTPDLIPVDLCEACHYAVYNFIFHAGKDDSK